MWILECESFTKGVLWVTAGDKSGPISALHAVVKITSLIEVQLSSQSNRVILPGNMIHISPITKAFLDISWDLAKSKRVKWGGQVRKSSKEVK